MILDLQFEFRDYLQKALGIQVHLDEPVESEVPFYLLDRYRLLKTEFLGKPCVLLMAREPVPPSPAILRKDGQRIQEILKRVPIWVSLQIDGVDRQRLIQYRVPFVLPGFQAYLPDLLVDVREYYQRLRANQQPGRLTPSAQHFLLEAFYRRFHEIDQVPSLGPNANYSPMTRSRVISELEAAGLAETKQHGRHRRAFITLPWAALWEKAHPLLCSPVRRRVHLGDDGAAEAQCLPRAGLSALAELSMLAAPRLPVYATVNRSSAARPASWRRFVTDRKDEARIELELWSYPPLVEKQPPGTVDRLSLYLSLQEDSDSRTQDALQTLLKEAL